MKLGQLQMDEWQNLWANGKENEKKKNQNQQQQQKIIRKLSEEK